MHSRRIVNRINPLSAQIRTGHFHESISTFSFFYTESRTRSGTERQTHPAIPILQNQVASQHQALPRNLYTPYLPLPHPPGLIPEKAANWRRKRRLFSSFSLFQPCLLPLDLLRFLPDWAPTRSAALRLAPTILSCSWTSAPVERTWAALCLK